MSPSQNVPIGALEDFSQDPVVGRFRWVIVAALFALATITYMDRFLLGVLKPTIVRDLHWTETDYANVVFCFQLAYAIGLLGVSRAIDWLGVRSGMMLVVALCAAAAASHSLVRSVIGFCFARFALGFGESGTWPGCIKSIGEWLPRKERALGNGLVNAGSSVGATVTPLLVPLLLRLVTWPFTFLFLAALDLFWLAAWFFKYRSPDRQPRLTSTERAYIHSDRDVPSGTIPWRELFVHRQTWAFLLAKGLTDPVWWFFLFWVPGFLAERYGRQGVSVANSSTAMAVPVMVIYAMSSVGSIGGGWLSMKLIEQGWTINVARKSVMLFCAICVTPIFAVSHDIGLWPSVFLIGLAGAAHLGFSSNLFTVATDTVPSHAVGSVVGIGGMAAAIGAMMNAKLTGYILDRTHSYAVPFAIASVSYLLGLGILHLLLPRLEPMRLRGEL